MLDILIVEIGEQSGDIAQHIGQIIGIAQAVTVCICRDHGHFREMQGCILRVDAGDQDSVCNGDLTVAVDVTEHMRFFHRCIVRGNRSNGSGNCEHGSEKSGCKFSGFHNEYLRSFVISDEAVCFISYNRHACGNCYIWRKNYFTMR